MEPRRVREGAYDRLTPAPAAGLSSSYPPDVARALSSLANLIDQSIQVRGVGIAVRDFAAACLRVPPTSVVVISEELTSTFFQLVAVAFVEDLEAHAPEAVVGQDAEEPPRWTLLDLGDVQARVPYQLAAAFPAGSVAPCPLVVSIQDSSNENVVDVSVYARGEDASRATAYLKGLLDRARRRTNPFKGRIVEVASQWPIGLLFRVRHLDPASRADVILPEEVWAAIDENVHAFFRLFDVLKSAGLARNRGILLDGPPGTGKSAAARVVAQELEGVTVAFCDAGAVGSSIRALYRDLADLAPALVVMEDLDLVVGHRRSGGGRTLNDFLLTLDGAMSGHEGVVTLATTNDVANIDPAAKRAARFDRIVRFPLPARTARAAILARYLREMEHEVDVDRVAGATEGATGADLRELVSLAVIRSAPSSDGSARPLSTEMLLDVARSNQEAGPGQYL
jgi:ATPase family associated with various cellular activities (AAA)